MARNPSTQPTDGELEILAVLWDAGPSELRSICAALQSRRNVATTTIATMLGVMQKKRLVTRSRGERGYVWSARVSRDEAATGLLAKLMDRVFDGSAQSLVMHLLDSGQLSDEERAAIQAMLDAQEQQRKSPRRGKRP